MSSYMDRLIGAAKLDVNTYEEVEADSNATGQAAATVVLSSLAAGIGAISVGGAAGLISVTLGALVGWLIWAGLIYLIGAKLMPESGTDADFGQVLRTIGFAASPGILRILGVIPVLGWLVNLVVMVWMLCTTVIAVRSALDYQSTGRAVAVCVIGWLVMAFVVGGIMARFAGPGMGMS